MSSGTGNCLTSWWESVNRERESHAPDIHLLSRTVRSVDIDRVHKYTAQADDSSVATEYGCAEGCLGDRGGGQEILGCDVYCAETTLLRPFQVVIYS